MRPPIVIHRKSRVQLLEELNSPLKIFESPPRKRKNTPRLTANSMDKSSSLRIEIAISEKISPWLRTVLETKDGKARIRKFIDDLLCSIRTADQNAASIRDGKRSPYGWTTIPSETRLTIISELRHRPLPWTGLVKDLRERFRLSHNQINSLINSVVSCGFDDPYLSGQRPLEELIEDLGRDRRP